MPDRGEVADMNERGFERLRVAIVMRAIQDYVEALHTIYRHSGATGHRKYYCTTAQNIIIDCEEFFMNDCDYFLDIDGEDLMNRLREKSRDKDFRIKRED